MSHLTITNPATGEVIDNVATATTSSIALKWTEAKAAQERWQRSSMRERLDCAVRFKTLLLAEVETLAQDLTRETGKPITQARGEIKSVTSRIDFFIEHTAKVLETKTVSPKDARVLEQIQYEPLGVVANISAWNYPYFVGLNVLVPALLAGNAVLYKPSEYAILSGLHIVRLLKAAGFPAVDSVIGGADVGDDLLALPFNGLFFTGSYNTGKRILDKVGSRMMRLQLELGGKDAIYVCDDSDLAFAVPSIADGAFYNTGQGCCSVERIYVQEGVYEAFKEGLLKEASAYRIGDPTRDDTYLGALTRPQHLAFLEDQVADAASQGCEVLLGGKRLDGPGAFFAPTVVECAKSNCRVLTEESFGPIVAIQRVHSDDDATRKINDSIYGLTAGVYSRSKERALAILDQAQVGSAYWNCCDRVSPFLPWSGRKASGVGVTLSDEGIRSFTQSKAWHLKLQA